MTLFILIVGGGKVGINLGRLLRVEGYEIVVIESNRRKYEVLEREFEHAAVLGDGTEMDTLERAGIARADYVLAVTGDDEDNIIICQLATEKYGVPHVVARVNNPLNQRTFDSLGITPTVSSVASILALVEQRLPRHRLLSLMTFEEENIVLMEVVVTEDSAVVGRKLADLSLPPGILLALIFRGHEALVPHGDVELRSEDRLMIVVERGKEDELYRILGRES